MFLDESGLPIVFEKLLIDVEKDAYKTAPLLLTRGGNILNNKIFPDGWCGVIYCSNVILSEIKSTLNDKYLIRVLENGVPTKIHLDNNSATLTTIPVSYKCGYSKIMYLFEDDDVRNLYTEGLSDCLDVFILDKQLRTALRKGIDVLYIDDTEFNSCLPKNPDAPTKEQLHYLLYLVHPLKVIGLCADNELPNYISSLCKSDTESDDDDYECT